MKDVWARLCVGYETIMTKNKRCNSVVTAFTHGAERIEIRAKFVGETKRQEVFYLTTYSTHFIIYGYMASNI